MMKKGIEWLKKEVWKQDIVMDKGYIYTDDLMSIINEVDEPEVLSQELPVVPTWFDKWWRNIIKGERNLLHNIGLFHEELHSYGTEETYEYINDPVNKKKLLNIIVNELDYLVEEGPKYYVNLGTAAYVAKWKDDRVDIYTESISGNDEFEFHLTEGEIKNFDERFWAFAEPVE